MRRLAVQADNSMVSILDKTKIVICKEDAVQITLTEPPVLTGQQASNGLWKAPIIQQSAPRMNLVTYYHPQIANNVVPTYKDKSLWDIPLPTTTWSPQEQQEIPQIYCALSAYTQPTLEALAIYLHLCVGFPVTETWCDIIVKGNYLSWSHLS